MIDLATEAARYLAAVDAFSDEGCPPTFRPEDPDAPPKPTRFRCRCRGCGRTTAYPVAACSACIGARP